MASGDASDEELMRAYVAGDAAAFRVLFDRYGPILFRLGRRHLPTDDLARELVQQTFFRLHGARHDFRLDARLRPWVMTIAMNLVREHYRRARRRPIRDVEVDRHPAPAPERSPLETEERARLLAEALEALPASQREVIELHWFEELPFAEVATIVGSSEGAVRVRAHRAYTRLRELLAEHLGPEGERR